MLKVIGIAFVGVICVKLIKDIKSDLVPLILVAVGTVILISLSDKITSAISVFDALSEKSKLGSTVFSSLLKIIGIGYITEYSASICDDCECGSIGKKIQFAGKLTIFIMALPIITGIIDTIGELL